MSDSLSRRDWITTVGAAGAGAFIPGDAAAPAGATPDAPATPLVREVLAPMPWSSIMPTGGLDVTRESLEPWFKAGVVAVGIGSKLISPDLIKARDWDGLTRRCKDVTALVREIRAAK